MAKFVLKSKFLNKNIKNRGGYIKYIAKREGVEWVKDTNRFLPATENQKELIWQILNDFPAAKENLEYEDYKSNPTRGNASEFISRTMEENFTDVANNSTYIGYIATRPGVEKMGTHGLFTDDGVPIVLDQIAKAVDEHPGNVWTHIISLRREDASRLGYDNAERWMQLMRSNRDYIAKQMKIESNDFQWYAAFHNEGHHPHIHVVAYSKSANSNAYLTKPGIEHIRSRLANDIFQQDAISVYEAKTEIRQSIKEEFREQINGICHRIETSTYSVPEAEQLMEELADDLSAVKGKKVYGYLKPELKGKVDHIVKLLSDTDDIKELYNTWYQQKNVLDGIYRSSLPEPVPLVHNREFSSIKNIVIKEAMKSFDGGRNMDIKEVADDTAETNSEPSNPDKEKEGEFTPKAYSLKSDEANTQSIAVAPGRGVISLIHQMSRMIQNKSQSNSNRPITEGKLRRKILAQKRAAGQKQGGSYYEL